MNRPLWTALIQRTRLTGWTGIICGPPHSLALNLIKPLEMVALSFCALQGLGEVRDLNGLRTKYRAMVLTVLSHRRSEHREVIG